MSASLHAAELEDVLLGLLLDHVDHVVDGDHAEQPAGRVDHRRRDQAVLAELEADLLLVHVDRDQVQLLELELGQQHAALAAQRPC